MSIKSELMQYKSELANKQLYLKWSNSIYKINICSMVIDSESERVSDFDRRRWNDLEQPTVTIIVSPLDSIDNEDRTLRFKYMLDDAPTQWRPQFLRKI